jgi:prevent-host-death family protein
MSESKPALERTMMASRFKAECLAVLDQVEQMRISVTVTKHGRPIARLVPLEPEPTPRPTMGSVHLVAEDDADYYGAGERWEADPSEA